MAVLVSKIFAQWAMVEFQLSLLLMRVLGADAAPALSMHEALTAQHLQVRALHAAAEAALALDQEQRHALRQLRKHNAQTALDIMDEILAGNIATLDLEKYGEVQEPVRAYVLLTPAHEDATAALSACA